jgi:uncharacterized membrane protein
MSLGFVPEKQVIAIGRIFFATGMIVTGGQQFFFGQFVPMVVPLTPGTIPSQRLWVYLTGAILIVAGGAILTGLQARLVSKVLGALFLLSFLLLYLPTNAMAGLKALTLSGCAFVIAGTFPKTTADEGRRNPIAWLDRFVPYGMYLLAIQVIVFGIDHYLYTAGIATLVPAWIPGHIFWTYFAGTALIASGVAMIARVKARLAATLLGVMILIWVLILHIPRAVANPGPLGQEWTSAFEALAKSGVALILGETLGKTGTRAGAASPRGVDLHAETRDLAG